MQKTLRWGIFFLMVLTFSFTVSSSFGTEGMPGRLVNPELLDAGNLQVVWENKLPIQKGESLERLFIIEGRIYALSSKNYMVALNKERGNVIFSKEIASAGFPVMGLELYGEELFSVAGNNLVEINTEFGAERSSLRLKYGAVCPAVRNKSYFYVAGSDKRVHVLQADNKVQIYEVAAESNSAITSLIASDEFVVFATEAGDVISVLSGQAKKIWNFNAAGGVAEPIVRDEKWLFVSSKDTNVYKLNILTGQLIWKYQTGGILERGPVVTANAVYQHARGEGLTAIDKEKGELIWVMKEGVDLLAEAEGKAYVITGMGTLVCMDNVKKKRVYTMNISDVTRYAVNVKDSNIYIGDDSGRVACLKPAD
jgi:outer membrane protein assembly factor BamB